MNIRTLLIAGQVGGLVLSLAACSSGPKQLNTNDIEVKGSAQNGDIVLKNDKAILRKETNAQDELRNAEWTNNKIEDDINREYAALKWCREDLADPRLGGTGDITPLPEIDNMKQAGDVKEEFGLNKKSDLAFVTEEDFLKRIQIERNYQTTLGKMLKTIRNQKDDCERRMGQARVKAGLPAKRYQGRSTVNAEGNLGKVIQPHETSLDDAFKILAQEKAQSGAK